MSKFRNIYDTFQYITSSMDSSTNTGVKCNVSTDNRELQIPMKVGNKDWDEIKVLIDDGTITVQDAD